MTQLLTKSASYVAARKVLGDHRKVYESVKDALAALKSIYALPGFPADFPIAAARLGKIDVTGDDSVPPLTEWPAEYSLPDVKVCVTFVGVRGLKDEKGETSNGARGFAVYPLHPTDAILADESGVTWIAKVVEKEASHVALRQLRNVNVALGVDAFFQAAMEMPISVSDYVEESTRDALDTTAFDSYWKQFRAMLGSQPSTAALAVMLPGKNEVLKAIRSKAFAVAEYPALETLPSGSAFVFIATSMIQVIDYLKANTEQKEGDEGNFDTTEIAGWLATRDSKVFVAAKKVEADLSTVDFGAFMSSVGLTNADEGTTDATATGAAGVASADVQQG